MEVLDRLLQSPSLSRIGVEARVAGSEGREDMLEPARAQRITLASELYADGVGAP